MPRRSHLPRPEWTNGGWPAHRAGRWSGQRRPHIDGAAVQDPIQFRAFLFASHLAAASLIGAALLLGGLGDALLRVLTATAGLVLTWLVLRRRARRAVPLSLLWLIATCGIAILPGQHGEAALLAVPPALWLIAAHTYRHGRPGNPTVALLLVMVAFVQAILFLGGHAGWMLPFAAGASGLFACRHLRTEALVVALGTLVFVLLRVHHLDLDRLLPVLGGTSMARPSAWVLVRDAGWFGHGPAIPVEWAAAPAVAVRWGWFGLGFLLVLEAALVAASVGAAALASKLAQAALTTPVAAILIVHIGLHFLFIAGCPVSLPTLPLFGSPAECFLYASLLTHCVGGLDPRLP